MTRTDLAHAHAHAHAKINLFLHVTGKRPDGYHTLDSLAVFASAADQLTITPADAPPGTVTLGIEGPFGKSLQPDASDNLILRAAHALCSTTARALPAQHITLHKNLPIASGIGGGSADAACALRLLATAWALDTPLPPLAATLGADVPVCLPQIPARMGGIGEILTPAPKLPEAAMLLVNCGKAVSTPAVFRARTTTIFTPEATLPAAWPTLDALLETLRSTTNDLEAPAIALCPTIATVLDAIATTPGCRFARMSGSGATCFGLFPTLDQAKHAATLLSAQGWWTSAGPIGDPAPMQR